MARFRLIAGPVPLHHQVYLDLRGALGDADYNKVKDTIAESSNYFGATVWVTIGTTDFTLYSLLVRGQGGLVRPQLRSIGTE